MRFRLVASVCLVVLLVACGKGRGDALSSEKKSGGSNTEPTEISDLLPFKVEYPDGGVGLGSGYDMVAGRWLPSRCVVGKPESLRASELRAEYSDLQDREQLMDSLKISASGGADFGAAGASASVEFSRRLTLDRTQRNVMANLLSMRGGQLLMPQQDSLSLVLHQETKAMSASDFRQKCGDGFVSAIRNGARRVLVFSYAIDSRELEESLKVTAEGKYGPAKGNASMERLRNEKDLRTKTRVTVFGKGGNSKALPVTAEDAVDSIKTFGDLKEEEAAPLEVVVTPYSALAQVPEALKERRLPGPAAKNLSAQYARFVELYDLFSAAAHAPSGFYHPFIPPVELGVHADGLKETAFCVSELLSVCALDPRAGGRCELGRLLELVKDKPYCSSLRKPDNEKTSVDWIVTELIMGRKKKEPNAAERSKAPPRINGAEMPLQTQVMPLPDFSRSPYDVYLEYFARAPLKKAWSLDKRTQDEGDEFRLVGMYCTAENLPCKNLPYATLTKANLEPADQQLALQALQGYLTHVKLAQVAGAACTLSLAHPLCQSPDTLPIYVPTQAAFGPLRGFEALAAPPAPPRPTTPRPPRDPCSGKVPGRGSCPPN